MTDRPSALPVACTLTPADLAARRGRFLRFALTIEPGDGPVTLAVTGPEGTPEFLEALLA